MNPCDARRPLSEIKLAHPMWSFPMSMPEYDPLWEPSADTRFAVDMVEFRKHEPQAQWADKFETEYLSRFPGRPRETFDELDERVKRGMNTVMDLAHEKGAKSKLHKSYPWREQH